MKTGERQSLGKSSRWFLLFIWRILSCAFRKSLEIWWQVEDWII